MPSVIAELGAASIKDMGKVMAALKERYAGQMDFGKASACGERSCLPRRNRSVQCSSAVHARCTVGNCAPITDPCRDRAVPLRQRLHCPHALWPSLLEEILRRTDIVQLVGRRVKLTRKGQAFWGCCPFHKEKSPCFKVENERRTYKCFGCGKGGDAFKWLIETEGLTFPEAVRAAGGRGGRRTAQMVAGRRSARGKEKVALRHHRSGLRLLRRPVARAPAAERRANICKSRGLERRRRRRQFRLGYAPVRSQRADRTSQDQEHHRRTT